MVSIHFRNICHLEAKQFIFILGLIASTHLLFQSLSLPYGNTLRSLLPINGSNLELKWSNLYKINSNSVALEGKDSGEEVFNRHNSTKVNPGDVVISLAMENHMSREKFLSLENDGRSLSSQQLMQLNNQSSSGYHAHTIASFVSNENARHELDSESHRSTSDDEDLLIKGASRNDLEFARRNFDTKSNIFSVKEDSSQKKKKKKPSEIPPKSVVTMNRMNQILARHFQTSRSTKPQWAYSPPDMEILDAKAKIMNARVSENNGELYAPLFRNISMFMKSYELMERTLKVYVYADGEKPIFHQPILKGLYASEGWFMKLMEANKHFVVKDPKRAHLFYMPFSSRMLEHTLYVPNSSNRSSLRQFVKNYSEKIAAKYPFWNRTGGMDHFLVACHDWALYETRHHMENSIKALCNADITIGFKIGRDVSLPETFIRFERNPLRDIGGKPPSQRHILVFYAGGNHGYLRPTLVKHWKDRHADMKIYQAMPPGVAKRMSYVKHMKSSKYCLCPKGHEVNSPRIVEAIYYECVPVIISDNYVPPFFEVFNWEAFSVVVEEKEIPRLREILVSIPEERYAVLQLGVRMVQRHFLWHARPFRYDLFHMTLHSIWSNRVFQTKPKMRM